MNTILQRINLFALNTYHGVRQCLLQFILLWAANEIQLLSGNSWELRYLGLDYFLIALYISLYTMLYYWFKTFTPKLHPLQQITIPYIPYALIIYLVVMAETDCGCKSAAMLKGLRATLIPLATIGIEYALTIWLSPKAKRTVTIIWNVFTILLATTFVVYCFYSTIA